MDQALLQTPHKLANLLSALVRALVDDPDQVQIAERLEPNEVHLTIRVADRDRGKVIGKSGATVSALRVVFGRIGAAEHGKVFIQMSD